MRRHSLRGSSVSREKASEAALELGAKKIINDPRISFAAVTRRSSMIYMRAPVPNCASVVALI
jgi:hypothetical protein